MNILKKVLKREQIDGRTDNRLLPLVTKLVLVFSLLSAADVSFAQDQWSDPYGGSFDVSSNWLDGSAPTNTESATYGISGTYDVAFDNITGDRTNSNILVTEGEVTFRSIGGAVYNYNSTAGILVSANTIMRVGETGVGGDPMNMAANGPLRIAGLMSISNGSMVDIDSFVSLSFNDGDFGNLFVQDSGTVLDIEGDIVAAGTGDAFVLVRDNATVLVGGNVLFGNGTTGNSESAVVGVANGASLSITESLYVGSLTNALMDVFNEAEITAADVNIGAVASAEGELIIRDDATLDASGTLRVGFDGEGCLAVESQAVVTAQDVIIGDTSTSSGIVLVSGASSMLMSNTDIDVGLDGMGLINLRDSGTIEAVGQIRIGATGEIDVNQPGLDATITAGSFLLNNGLLDLQIGSPTINANVFNLASIRASSGSITRIEGNLVHDGEEVFTSLSSAVRIAGRASGVGPYTGFGTVRFEADIEPGIGNGILEIGTMSFEGDVEMIADTITQIEIEGSAANEFDRLVIDGDLSVDGVLNLYDEGHSFVDGNEFVFIEVGGNRTGEFDGLPEGEAITTFDDVELFITYAGGDGNDIAIVTKGSGVLLGDVNLDGVVNLLDVGPFVDVLSSGNFQAEADINGDGVVDLLDVGGFVDLLTG